MLAGQAFKVVDERTRTFRGGPMYYMERGLGSRGTAMCFTLLLLFTFGLAFVALQSFTAPSSLEEAFAIPVQVTGIAMTAIVAITIFADVQGLPRVTEIIVPVLALAPMAVALCVVGFNLVK